MKPFDLEAAKAGEPIVCRDGRPVKFIAHVPEAYESEQVIALVGESIELFYESGMYNESTEDCRDLFMASKKRTVWVNFYPDGSAKFWASQLIADDTANISSMWKRLGNRAYPVEIEG